MMTRHEIETATRIADAAIAEVEALRALVGTRQQRLAKAAGTTLAGGLAKTVAAGVAQALEGRGGPTAPTETAADDVMLAKAVDAVVEVTGETDPAKIAAWIVAASRPVDMAAERDTAVALAKSIHAAPAALADDDVVDVVLHAARLEKAAQADRDNLTAQLREDAGRVARHAEAFGYAEEARLAKVAETSAATVWDCLRDIYKHPRVETTAERRTPYVDRRAELLALRDRQRSEFGNFAGALLTSKELELAEARAATAVPSSVFPPPAA